MIMNFRRRTYIVDAGLQMKVALVFAAVSLTASTAAVAAFNYFSLKRMEAVMWSTHIAVRTTGEIVGPLFIYTNVINFIAVLILLIITIMWMMRKTRGPLYRMSRDIQRVADGDIAAEVTLRQKDEFKNAANELDLMVKSMRGWFVNFKNSYSDISRSIAALEKESRGEGSTVKTCDSILKKIDDLEAEMNKIKNSQLE
jgi:methyl-accepting chemotaxis protein